MISRAKERPLWLPGVSEERRKAKAKLSSAAVEEQHNLAHLLRVSAELSQDMLVATAEPPSDEEGFRAMTPMVEKARTRGPSPYLPVFHHPGLSPHPKARNRIRRGLIPCLGSSELPDRGTW